MRNELPLVVSLTTIPPRFGQLPQVVAALQAQDRAPDQIILCLPQVYRRFAGPITPPDLPGLRILRPPTDPGPAGKLTLAAQALRGQGCRLPFCDDDWLYGPGWTQGFLDAARKHPEAVICGASFAAQRLGLPNAPDTARIAQGFAGVMLQPDWLDDAALNPPQEAWPVDDIWLSAQFARLGRAVIQAPGLRAQASPLPDPEPLQDAVFAGEGRGQLNQQLAHKLATQYHIWGL
ncbi:MAG TPA: glycosyltransferase family 2 protein [Aliiroseovarius sp.]|nr:glycosyltransferase family 2 protein [Aliiroseovarius sp.]